MKQGEHITVLRAYASLIFDSAKYSKLEETPSLAFFALSAYAFETAMVDQQDGYTIMCSADSASSNNKETTVEVADGDEKAVDRRVKGYVLWEFTCD